jgi:hypothetical protein
MERISLDTQIQSIIHKIFNRLLDTNIEDSSLFTGNSGILLFLNEYYRVYKTDQCYDRIEVLIQSIIEGLNKTSTISFSNGITRIT